MAKLRRMIDLSGQKFGKWTVIKQSEMPLYGQITAFECVCDCGTRRIVGGTFLYTGKTRSCGCEAVKNAAAKNRRHGLWKHPLQGVWRSMKQRCYNTKSFGYKNYGSRGITVCDRWRDSFSDFATDMLPTYRTGLTLERKDVNGPYCPDNCIWATPEEQSNNRRDNQFIEHFGKRQTVAQWAREVGIVEQVLRKRLFKSKWAVEKALTTPVKGRPLNIIAR